MGRVLHGGRDCSSDCVRGSELSETSLPHSSTDRLQRYGHIRPSGVEAFRVRNGNTEDTESDSGPSGSPKPHVTWVTRPEVYSISCGRLFLLHLLILHPSLHPSLHPPAST